MELRDALVPFRPAEPPAIRNLTEALPWIRVAFLTERPELDRAMQQALRPSRMILTQVFSVELIERAINKNLVDVAIVDIERQDEWPSSIFSRFDALAASFPIIILCNRKQEILSYLWKARHAVYIFSYEEIDDPRFPSTIQAAQLRADIIRDNSFSDNRNDGESSMPPPGAWSAESHGFDDGPSQTPLLGRYRLAERGDASSS